MPFGLAAFSFLLTRSPREVSLGAFETSHTLGRGASFAQQDGRIFIALITLPRFPRIVTPKVGIALATPSVRVCLVMDGARLWSITMRCGVALCLPMQKRLQASAAVS